MPRYATSLLLVAAVPVLAGCGDSSPSGQQALASTKQHDAIAFASCMRAHGVSNFPDPTAGSGGGLQIQASQRAGSGQSLKINGVSVNAPAFQSAMSACRSKLPYGGNGPPGGIAKLKQTALKFAACMRTHGVPNFPDPQVSSGPGGGVGIRVGGAGVDPKSPAFQSAQKSCGPIMGKAPPGAPGAAQNGP